MSIILTVPTMKNGMYHFRSASIFGMFCFTAYDLNFYIDFAAYSRFWQKKIAERTRRRTQAVQDRGVDFGRCAYS
jgi:hypothetical protein